MNILRRQRPYVFHPPKYSPWLMPLVHALAEIWFLRRKFKIRQAKVGGVEPVVRLVRAGHSVLVAPNHADHADPSLLLTIGRRHGLRFHFMAAREGFERNVVQSFFLQRAGAFSVDREGADLASIKMAMNILQSGLVPLVIFPEGEIWHHHEQLDLLNEGVATILLRATAKLPPGKKGYLVPTAIRIGCDERVRETFSERLSRLEQRVMWKPRPEMEVSERIYRLGSGLIALKEQEFLGGARTGGLVERIHHLQQELVARSEKKHGVSPGAETSGAPERIKAMRNRIRRRLNDPGSPVTPEEERALYDDLDTLFLASQLYSYPGQYLKETPSVHRVAETIFKLEEDLLGQGCYVGPRQAEVHFDEPLDVQQFLQKKSLDVRSGVKPLTQFLSQRVQVLLNTLK
jgi:hypothetical protein